MVTKPIQSPAVVYPEFTAGGKKYFLCWGPAGRYQLQKFGYWSHDSAGNANTNPIPVLAWAAAGAGTVEDGLWRSSQFDSPFELARQMSTEDEGSAAIAVVAMLKNMMPEATLTLVGDPANSEAA